MRPLFFGAALLLSASFAQAQVDTTALIEMTKPQGPALTAKAVLQLGTGNLLEAGHLLASIDPNDSLFLKDCIYAARLVADTAAGETEIGGILQNLRRYWPEETETIRKAQILYHKAGKRGDSVLHYTQPVLADQPTNEDLAAFRASQLFKDKKYGQLAEEAKVILPWQPGNSVYIRYLAQAAYKEHKYGQFYTWCLFGVAGANGVDGAHRFLSMIESTMLESTEAFAGQAQLPAVPELDELDDILQSGAATKSGYKYTGPYAEYRAMKQIHLFLSAIAGKSFKGTSALETVALPYITEIEKEQKWPNVTGAALYLATEGAKGKQADYMKWTEARQSVQNKVPALHVVQFHGKRHTVDAHYSGGAGQVAMLVEGEAEPKPGVKLHAVEMSIDGYMESEFDLIYPKQVEGVFKFYYPNGKLKAETQFSNGKANGYSRAYSNQGVLLKDITYVDDKEDGTERYFFAAGGMRVKEDRTTAGKTTGYENSYFRNGMLQDSVRVVDEQVDGPQWRYDETGAVSIKAFAKKGQADGLRTEYYNSGAKYKESNYRDGKLSGKVVEYFSNGRVNQSMLYENDKLIDTLYVYDRNGSLTEKDAILKDYANRREYYYDHGRLYSTHIYKADKLTSVLYRDASGKEIQQDKLDKGRRTIKLLYPNGQARQEYGVLNGAMDGLCVYYSRWGVKRRELTYKGGNKTGTETTYYADGTVASQSQYQDGIEEGLQLDFHTNGVLKEAYFAQAGDINGYRISFDAKGRTTDRDYYDDGTLTGWAECLDSAGHLKTQTRYRDGAEIGYRTWYGSTFLEYKEVSQTGIEYPKDEQARKVAKFSYRNGALDGAQVLYHPATGKTECEYERRIDTYVGKYRLYDETGRLDFETDYGKHGTKTGKEASYRAGQLWDEEIFLPEKDSSTDMTYDMTGRKVAAYCKRSGDLHGWATFFDPTTGAVAGMLLFDEDELVAYASATADGKPAVTYLSKAEETVVTHYPSGEKGMEFQVRDGFYNGPYKRYYESGQILHETTRRNGGDQGASREYFADGKLAVEENFVADHFFGTASYYHPSGKLRARLRYYDQVRQGVQQYYKEDGTLLGEYTVRDNKAVSAK